MKILKHGKPPGDQKHRETCDGCGTEIEFLTSEATRVSDPRDGDFWRIQCPVCPRAITKQVPPARYY